MLLKRYSVLLALLLLFFSNINTSQAQCSVVSSNGWTATVSITPTAVVPEFADCPWYYHYEVRYNYTITFTGSTTGRSFSCNAYFNCSGGTGGNPYNPMGTFTGNTSGTFITSNNTRQYTSSSAYNYASNPSCTTITLPDVNCTSVRLDYWGNGIANGSITCPLGVAPLPIELLSFDAVAENHKVDLKWVTASELNNDYFTIEKSSDGIHFAEVLRVKGAGNSSSVLEYADTDNNPYTGVSYYRIKQTDYNGDYSYSKIVAVESGRNEVITNVYPNPSNGTGVNVYVSSTSESPVELSIYNPLGQLVSHMELQPNEKGIIDQPINLPENGNLFFVSFSQDNVVTGYHKLCVSR